MPSLVMGKRDETARAKVAQWLTASKMGNSAFDKPIWHSVKSRGFGHFFSYGRATNGDFHCYDTSPCRTRQPVK